MPRECKFCGSTITIVMVRENHKYSSDCGNKELRKSVSLEDTTTGKIVAKDSLLYVDNGPDPEQERLHAVHCIMCKAIGPSAKQISKCITLWDNAHANS